MKAILFLVAIAIVPFKLAAQTPRVNFTAPELYPEGVTYHPGNGLFYVSSVKTGTIGTVDANGSYKKFYEDSSLKSSFGMKIDAKRNILWVCTGDPHHSKYADSSTHKKMIRVIGLDLKTSKKTFDVDLSNLVNGKHFANDLAIDDSGNLYITDSYSPVIYKVDGAGKASVFAQHDWFRSLDVGLNGIVWSNKGYLIVAHNSDGQLYKVSTGNPTQISKIRQPTFFPGADGLLWDEKGNLTLVQNKGVHKVFQLSSTDNWDSLTVTAATATEDRFVQPSTSTWRNKKLYALNSKMNELSDPTAPPSKEFSLQEVVFRPIK